MIRSIYRPVAVVAVVLGGGLAWVWLQNGDAVAERAVAPTTIVATPTPPAMPAERQAAPVVPFVEQAPALPAPPPPAVQQVKVNRAPLTGTSEIAKANFRMRQKLIAQYDAWLAGRNARLEEVVYMAPPVTPEQEAKVLRILANTQANYELALEESHKLVEMPGQEATDDFSELHMGEALEEEMTVALGEVLTESQVTCFRYAFPIFSLLFSPGLDVFAPVDAVVVSNGITEPGR